MSWLLFGGKCGAGQRYRNVSESASEDERCSLESSISQDVRVSSIRKKVKVSQRRVPSSEMSPLYSYMPMDSSGFGSCTAPQSSEDRWHTSIDAISKLEAQTKHSSGVLHIKTLSTVDVKNGSYESLDDSSFEDSASKILGHSDWSNDGLDGYESGVAERTIYKWHFCKQCNRLYKKAKRARQSAEEIPKKHDPNHWTSKFWMMMNRFPLQKKNRGKRKEQNRSLKIVVRNLQRNKPTNTLQLPCSRIHSFLNRNLRSCVKAKKLLNVPNPGLKRKKSTYLPKPQSKKRRESALNHSKLNPKMGYTFALDCSGEVEAINVKRDEVRGKNGEMNNLQNPGLPLSKRQICYSTASTAVYSDDLAHVDSQDEDSLSLLQQSLNINPQEYVRSSSATSSPFAHVQSGSFRDLLERMNSGYLRSGIVYENQIRLDDL